MRLIILFTLINIANSYPDWFYEYKKQHRKLYSIEEEARAFNVLEPKYHFAKKHGYDLYHHSDVNRSALHNPFKNFKCKNCHKTPKGNHRLGLPLSMDWRTHGAVTSVKRQGTCGGCFAFAAAGQFEYWYWKKKHKLIDFSIQQWIDCSKPENFGCDGGLMHYVFHKAMQSPAGPETFDKYRHKDGICLRRNRRPWVKVKSYVVQSDEQHINVERHLAHNIVQYGPIPVGIDSSNYHFELYKGGVLKENRCGKDIDHAVLVVGFTPKYWIVKNSWGSHWGQGGYIYLERWKNTCGINSYASFITDASI